MAMVDKGKTVMYFNYLADEAEYCDRIGWFIASKLRHEPDSSKNGRCDDNPTPSMEDAFVGLVLITIKISKVKMIKGAKTCVFSSIISCPLFLATFICSYA